MGGVFSPKLPTPAPCTHLPTLGSPWDQSKLGNDQMESWEDFGAGE